MKAGFYKEVQSLLLESVFNSRMACGIGKKAY